MKSIYKVVYDQGRMGGVHARDVRVKMPYNNQQNKNPFEVVDVGNTF